MTLHEWFSANKSVSKTDFATRIEVSRQALDRYMRGERMPRPKVMVKISAATGGAVSANDFMKADAPSTATPVQGATAG